MFAKLAVSVAIAFLGAYPLAEASGLFHQAEVYRGISEGGIVTASGVILFFLTLSLIGPILRLFSRILEALKNVEERPGPMMALAMLGLGTLLAISAMVVQYNAGSSSTTGLSMNLGVGSNPPMVMRSSGSPVLGILTILTFLLGTALISLGIWSSFRLRSRPVDYPMVKPASRELDEAAT